MGAEEGWGEGGGGLDSQTMAQHGQITVEESRYSIFKQYTLHITRKIGNNIFIIFKE